MSDPANPVAEVRAVVERYFAAIDARDWALLETCFLADGAMCVTASAPDGTGGHWANGWPEVRDLMRTLEQFPCSTHSIANVSVEVLDESSATATTNALAYILNPGAGGSGTVLVRGLRYFDRVVRADGAWKLQRRVHMALWQFEADATATTLQPVR